MWTTPISPLSHSKYSLQSGEVCQPTNVEWGHCSWLPAVASAIGVGAEDVRSSVSMTAAVAQVKGKQNIPFGQAELMQLWAAVHDASNSSIEEAQNNCCSSAPAVCCCESEEEVTGCCVDNTNDATSTSATDGEYVTINMLILSTALGEFEYRIDDDGEGGPVDPSPPPHMNSFQQYSPSGQSSVTVHFVAVAHTLSKSANVLAQNWASTPSLLLSDDTSDSNDDESSVSSSPSAQASPIMKHFKPLKQTPSGQSYPSRLQFLYAFDWSSPHHKAMELVVVVASDQSSFSSSSSSSTTSAQSSSSSSSSVAMTSSSTEVTLSFIIESSPERKTLGVPSGSSSTSSAFLKFSFRSSPPSNAPDPFGHGGLWHPRLTMPDTASMKVSSCIPPSTKFFKLSM